MKEQTPFIQRLEAAYAAGSDALLMGCAMLDGIPLDGVKVSIPLRTLNRHGLITGATGTGKTKSLQVLAENLSRNSVPVVLMDIKGDLSGIAAPGTSNDKIIARAGHIGYEWKPEGFPVELMNINNEPGVRLRSTVSEFGPVLFSRILGLNETQQGVMALVFKYCDDHGLPLLDLMDVKKTLQYLTNEGKAEIEQEYGKISAASTGTITRKIIELEQQGAEVFFGERSFEVDDLVRIDDQGRGMISIIRVDKMQDRPRLFSTFMLSLLAEIYDTFPEEGDLDRPKLCLFIDEAHLLFDEATDELLDQIETVVRLIRSKGVGIFFCTQLPTDIPQQVLAQLGLKVQHALRAFTAKDRKDIRLIADNFPLTDDYNLEEVLTGMGIGEALVTALNHKGIPTPVVHTLMAPPASRMDILTAAEISALITSSALARKYAQPVDRDSAAEILTAKIEAAREESARKQEEQQKEKEENRTIRKKTEKSTLEEIADSKLTRDIGRTVTRELTRGLLGALGLGGRKKKGLFW